jgi:ATP-binding protein involved in chromosome partitioning
MPLKMFPSEPAKPAKLAEPAFPLNKIAHVIAIAAGKGGVGKSTVTANLALALRSAGYGVGVLDADLYGPSIRQMLPEKTLPMQKSGQKSGQEGSQILPAITKEGIQTISLAFFRKANESMAVRAPIANSVIMQFLKNIQWKSLDFLLIDFPPGTGDIQLTLSQHARLAGAVLVTTPQEVALMDVRKAAHLFAQTRVPLIGVLENMSYYQRDPSEEKIYLFGKGGGKRLAEELGAPFLGQIPIDPELCEYGDGGRSIFECSRNLPSKTAFEDFAKQFVAQATARQQAAAAIDLVWQEMST